MRLLLDTGILAWACHPRRYREVQEWLLALAAQPHELMVSPSSERYRGRTYPEQATHLHGRRSGRGRAR